MTDDDLDDSADHYGGEIEAAASIALQWPRSREAAVKAAIEHGVGLLVAALGLLLHKRK